MSTEIKKQLDVACIGEGAPYGPAAKSLIEAAEKLQPSPAVLALKTVVASQLFHRTEEILKGKADPIPLFIQALDGARALLANAGFYEGRYTEVPPESYGDIRDETGDHYGSLFREFDPKHYFDEASGLLRTRFERNGFDFAKTAGKTALDAGCGGGRYTVGLSRLGFAEAVGVDYSDKGVAFASKQVEQAGIKNVRFQKETVLKMSFPDETFDFVYCNGVLHHTTDMPGGVHEVLRVLKSGGSGFLYLIENPGGIFWDVIEILRPVLKDVPYHFARAQFAALGVPANRRYYILDHIMVPINIRSTPEEVEGMLRAAGARNIRRMTRGVDFDRVEQIHQGVPYAREKFGVGENRYFFDK